MIEKVTAMQKQRELENKRFSIQYQAAMTLDMCQKIEKVRLWIQPEKTCCSYSTQKTAANKEVQPFRVSVNPKIWKKDERGFAPAWTMAPLWLKSHTL